VGLVSAIKTADTSSLGGIKTPPNAGVHDIGLGPDVVNTHRADIETGE